MIPRDKEIIQQNDRKWEALLRISEEAHTAESIESFVDTIHKILGELVLARNFFIGLYDEPSGKYFFPYFEDEFDKIETTGVHSDFDESLDTTLYDLTGTLSDYVRHTGRSLRFPNDAMNHLYESGEIKLFGSKSTSWMGVPLKFSGKTYGVMVVQDYNTVDAYSLKDEELMVFVSDHIARAIENVRAEETSKKQIRLLMKQSEAITDSIKYARRIQKAALPSPPYIRNILPEFFAIFKPKDIISGDFYWVREIDGIQVVIVADCTGHGVPGALMSMLGVTLLNEQFRTFGVRQPNEVLGHLRNKVKQILAQEGSVQDQKDGMDMSIAIIDRSTQELQFAGANRPLFIYRNASDGEAEFIEIKGDRQPIGSHWEEKEFTHHSMKLQEGDSLYMFTDGYPDQYGGLYRKKFKIRKFKELLLSVQSEPMHGQGEIIENTFDRWSRGHEQIDDVCVFGWRFHPEK